MSPLTVYSKSVDDIPKEPSIESAFSFLELPEVTLTSKQIKRFERLCKKLGISHEPFDPSDLDELKSLVKAIQRQVVFDNHQILSSASIRDLSSLTGAITSLLRLFTASQKTIDDAKAIQSLFNAVMSTISILPEKYKKVFWTELEQPKYGFVDTLEVNGGDNHG